jgi:hypothetical protein
MTTRSREPVKQSKPAARQSRTHVTQSTHVSASQLKTPSGARREPVNQSHLKK